uniref:Uncharacterized protein n=1 Tax=Amphimedon queenslandica TaxID=400682 RepID=A0A1X7SUP7_AMPQE
ERNSFVTLRHTNYGSPFLKTKVRGLMIKCVGGEYRNRSYCVIHSQSKNTKCHL